MMGLQGFFTKANPESPTAHVLCWVLPANATNRVVRLAVEAQRQDATLAVNTARM